MGTSERGGGFGAMLALSMASIRKKYISISAGGAAAVDVDFECVRRGVRVAGGAPAARLLPRSAQAVGPILVYGLVMQCLAWG